MNNSTKYNTKAAEAFYNVVWDTMREYHSSVLDHDMIVVTKRMPNGNATEMTFEVYHNDDIKFVSIRRMVYSRNSHAGTWASYTRYYDSDVIMGLGNK